MADNEYIRGLSEIDLTDTFLLKRKTDEIIQNINRLMTSLYDMPTYENNAAAVSGGVASGELYYDSTLGGVRIVT